VKFGLQTFNFVQRPLGESRAGPEVDELGGVAQPHEVLRTRGHPFQCSLDEHSLKVGDRPAKAPHVPNQLAELRRRCDGVDGSRPVSVFRGDPVAVLDGGYRRAREARRPMRGLDVAV
jgi:hypothetical protein